MKESEVYRTLNISGIIFPAINAYDGVAYEIYVSGCTRNCIGCHSPELQDFNNGKPLDISSLLADMKDKDKWFDIISILGGDLLCQDDYLARYLMTHLIGSFPDKKYWLFTGANQDEIPKWCFRIFDVIKCGTYEERLKTNGFPSSSNQKLLRKDVDYD